MVFDGTLNILYSRVRGHNQQRVPGVYQSVAIQRPSAKNEEGLKNNLVKKCE